MGLRSIRNTLEALQPGDYVCVHCHASYGGDLFEGYLVPDSNIVLQGHTVHLQRLREYDRPRLKSCSFPGKAVEWIEVDHG